MSSYGTSGNFQSNLNGGILNQLLQYATGTELAFVDTAIRSVIPQAILDTFGQNWFTVPTMGFRLPAVTAPATSVSSFTAAHWQSWSAIGFNIVSAINVGATASTQQYTIDNTYVSDDFGTVNPRYLTNQILEMQQLLLENARTSVSVGRFSAGAAGVIFTWTIRDFDHAAQNQYIVSILCQPNYD